MRCSFVRLNCHNAPACKYDIVARLQHLIPAYMTLCCNSRFYSQPGYVWKLKDCQCQQHVIVLRRVYTCTKQQTTISNVSENGNIDSQHPQQKALQRSLHSSLQASVAQNQYLIVLETRYSITWVMMTPPKVLSAHDRPGMCRVTSVLAQSSHMQLS